MKLSKFYKLYRLRKQVSRLKRIPVTANGSRLATLTKGTNVDTSIALGAATGGVANVLYDWSTLSDPEQALHLFEQRYPNEFFAISPEAWQEKLALMRDNEDVLRGYVNGYAGFRAEQEAVETLEQMGFTTTVPDSVNHPDFDVYASSPDGNIIPVQVKSYGDESAFMQVVREKEGVIDHYMVNTELYDSLERSGRLSTLSDNGIHVWDGGYSNTALRDEAYSSLEQLPSADAMTNSFESGGAHTLPILSIAVATFTILQAAKQVQHEQMTIREWRGFSGGEIIKAGTRTSAGLIGAKTFALLASSFSFPFGPIAMVAGGIYGARIGGKIGTRIQTNLQYNKLIKSQYELSELFTDEIPTFVKQWIHEKVLAVPEVEHRLARIRPLLRRYAHELDVSDPAPPTMCAVLLEAYVHHLEHYLENVEHFTATIEKEIKQSFIQLNKDFPYYLDAEQLKGEWLARLMIDIHEFVPKHHFPKMEAYIKHSNLYPNHPFALPFSPSLSLLYRGYQFQGGLS